ncbi:MAG: 23S rRNA (adenine(2030)-N(6))-methyltransferase RlmJ [Acetobacteraceae bacterium]|nr:23S rRNA (adenine(2030)-N(6))-methyltransferase RlmJ [Acetobacteraceae bacterium]
MNYRHAFHAGNFADCVKHALLVWIVRALARKTTPFRVLDTHAGRGGYDLLAEAERTGEWRDGIARILGNTPPPLADYAGLVEQLGLYPGSPLLVRALLRDGDQLACCELHRDDAAALRHRFARDPQVAVHHRDGYEAVRALLPPPERRGLVLLDPPFEQDAEWDRLLDALRDGVRRFAGGVYTAWYPIKGRAATRAFHERVRDAGLRDAVAAELWLREPVDAARLNGCGLLVRNPPYGFEADWPGLLAALLERLGQGEVGQGTRLVRIADE